MIVGVGKNGSEKCVISISTHVIEIFVQLTSLQPTMMNHATCHIMQKRHKQELRDGCRSALVILGEIVLEIFVPLTSLDTNDDDLSHNAEIQGVLAVRLTLER